MDGRKRGTLFTNNEVQRVINAAQRIDHLEAQTRQRARERRSR